MDERNELVFRGLQAKLDDFVARLSSAGGLWVHDPKSDPSASRLGRALPGVSFTGPADSGGAAGPRLVLAPRAAGELYVATITAGDRPTRPLAADEYNGHLAAFAAFAVPHAQVAGVEMVGPGRRKIKLREYTTPAAAALAERFLSQVNSAHPHALDRKRWRAFAIRAYQDGAIPDRAVIHDWLAGQGWDESGIGPLTDDYEAALELLSEYDEAVSRT